MVKSDEVVWLLPKCEKGESFEIHGINIGIPKKPKRSEILFYEKPKRMQMWSRLHMPEELSRVRDMDEWFEKPSEFRKMFSSYIEKEFERRHNGVWFYNNGVPTYITGRHYMFLQWSKIDIGYPSYLASRS